MHGEGAAHGLCQRPPRARGTYVALALFHHRGQPRAGHSPLARLQAASSQRVTNLPHELVELTPFDTHLLPLLDGTHGQPSLIEELFALLQQGALNISEDDHPVADQGRARDIL